MPGEEQKPPARVKRSGVTRVVPVQRNEFSIGDCVRLSELGRKNARRPERRGAVIGVSKTGTAYRILWSGQKGAEVVHESFLERDDLA